MLKSTGAFIESNNTLCRREIWPCETIVSFQTKNYYMAHFLYDHYKYNCFLNNILGINFLNSNFITWSQNYFINLHGIPSLTTPAISSILMSTDNTISNKHYNDKLLTIYHIKILYCTVPCIHLPSSMCGRPFLRTHWGITKAEVKIHSW